VNEFNTLQTSYIFSSLLALFPILSSANLLLINKSESVSVCLSVCMYVQEKLYILLPCCITIGYIMYWIYCCTTIKTSTVSYIVGAVDLESRATPGISASDQ
jgi:hypothetical protein